MYSIKEFYNTESSNISVIHKLKENECKSKQNLMIQRKDPKEMTIEELDEILDKKILNVKALDKLERMSNLSSNSIRFLNFQDPIKNKIEKHLVNTTEKTDNLIKEFNEDALNKNYKNTSIKYEKFPSKKQGLFNNLINSNNIQSFSSMINISNAIISPIKIYNEKISNYERKCNEDKIIKLNKFLDKKLKSHKNDIEKEINFKENQLIKEKEELVNELAIIKNSIEQNETQNKLILCNNEMIFKEVEIKLKNDILKLKNENTNLKSMLDEQVQSNKKIILGLTSENETLKGEIDILLDKLKVSNDNLINKNKQFDSIKKEMEDKINKEVEDNIQFKEKFSKEKKKLIEKIQELVEKLEKLKSNMNHIPQKTIKPKTKANYLKNTKSKQNLLKSKPQFSDKIIDNNRFCFKSDSSDESSHDDIMKKLNSTNIDIVDETNLKNIQENIKEFQKSFDVLSNQKQKSINKDEIIQLNRNISLIKTNLDRERQQLSLINNKKSV